MADTNNSDMREEERRGGFAPDDETFQLERLERHPSRPAAATPESDIDAADDISAEVTDAGGVEAADDDAPAAIEFEAPMSVDEALRLADEDIDDEDFRGAAPAGIADAPFSLDDDDTEFDLPAAPAAPAAVDADLEETLGSVDLPDDIEADLPAPDDAPAPPPAPEAPPAPPAPTAPPAPPAPSGPEEAVNLGQAESENAHAESISLGEELKAIIREDLSKSKSRERTPEAPPASAIVEADEVGQDVGEDHADAPEIDLSDVESRSHPSQQEVEQATDATSTNATATDAATKPTSKSAKNRRSKSARKKFGLLPIAAVLLVLVMASAAAWFLLDSPNPFAGSEAADDSTAVLADAEHADDHTADHTTGDAEAQDAEHAGDHVAANDHADGAAEEWTEHGDAEPRGNAHDSEASPRPATDAEHGNSAHSAAEIQAGANRNNQEEPSVDHAEVETAHDAVNAESAVESTNKPAASASPSTAEAGTNKSAPARQTAPSPRGEYVVQIYSSPSLEDAEEWLHKLQNDNIPSAFITTQYIRDRIWYRVRFGIFETREDAERSARNLGYARAWVVRVR